MIVQKQLILTTKPSRRYSKHIMNKKQQTQQTIISAGVQVIKDQGAGAFTLDAVAHQAGVSKGGLLYHFPNKDSLISGMLEHYLDSFDEVVENLSANDPSSHAWIKAFVVVTFNEHPSDVAIVASQLAAIINNADLLTPMRQRYAVWLKQAIDEGLPPDLAQLIITASDGYWYAQMFGINPLTDEVREALLTRLLSMIEDV